MRKRAEIPGSFLAVLLLVPATTGSAQGLKGSREAQTKAPQTASINWGDKKLANQLAGHVVAGPKITLQHSGPNSSSAMTARLKQQQQSAPAPGGTSNTGNSGLLLAGQPKTLLTPASSGSLGPAKADAANTSSTASSGSSPAQAQSGRGSSTSAMTHAQPATTACLHAGITAVDKAPTGIVFSPGYSYVIHGCGFGNQPGSVYLMGVKQQPPTTQGINVVQPGLHSDWVRLLLAGANSHLPQRNWSNTEIQAIVDPNTSGFYDSSTATLVVILSDNLTQLQAHGFSFFAGRATQTLASLPSILYGASSPTQLGVLRSGTSFSPARVTDVSGHAVQANLVSPSANSIVLPGHTFAVVREDNAASFPAGTDSINLVYGLQSGFEVQSIQLFNASLTQSTCPTTFSADGNWNAAQMGSADNISVSWQEQSCGHNGVSAYAIDVTVVGPRGVSPF